MADFPTSSTDPEPWWRSAVIYQVYVRSFADSNGDGVGDLPGIRSRLDHIAQLGADAIWLNPFYPSPQADAGYDVADYRDVDPLFGTLEEADALLQAAHDNGLKVLIDLVPNHTSSEHEWFSAALRAEPGSRERSRYIFREGRGPRGEQPPNNWLSQFGGPAWTRVADGYWYLHLFAPAQPDLDWTNPEVIEEFQSILRFWLDRGVDGFRIDVAHGLAKDPALPDLSDPDPNLGTTALQESHPFWDQDAVHEVYEGWRRVFDSYPGDRTSVAEAWVEDPDRLALYLRPTELHTAFNFNFLEAPWSALTMRRVIDETLHSLHAVGAPATWVLSNHDVVRHVTRYGGGELGLRRARAATLLMLALPGGAYIYQGEELGLEEVLDIPNELRQDPTFVQTKGQQRGRDGCRVPLPWSGVSAPFGFGPSGAPWLPQPSSWRTLSVEAQQNDAGSTLNFYKTALRLRRELLALGDGHLQWIPTDGDMLAFRRAPAFACAINFRDSPTALPETLRDARISLGSSSSSTRGTIAASSAAWFEL